MSKNVRKTGKTVRKRPEITSSAFYRPSFSISRRKVATTRRALDAAEPMAEIVEGIYQAAVGSVYVYGEAGLQPGKPSPPPYLQLTLTAAGRTYSLSFDELPSNTAISRRCLELCRQVEQMIRAGVRRLPFRSPVPELTLPALATPAPQLFNTLTRAQHQDEVDAILSMLQDAAGKSEAHLRAALSHARKASAGLRKFYGLPAATTTETPAR